ncbi:MAG: hypothetical protein MJ211_11155 [Bacteroidales bacterium]|nr:hypothetical protein [Bacteroidales bacterium]
MKTFNVNHKGTKATLTLVFALLVFVVWGVSKNLPNNNIESDITVESSSNSKCKCKIELPYKYMQSLAENDVVEIIVNGISQLATIESVDKKVVKDGDKLSFYAYATLVDLNFDNQICNADVVLNNNINYVKDQLFHSIVY